MPRSAKIDIVSSALQAAFGPKEAARLAGPFMSAFQTVLLPVDVLIADDLILLTPEQAQSIDWEKAGKPFKVARNRLLKSLGQVTQQQRLCAVLRRFPAEIGLLLGDGEYLLELSLM